MDPYRRACAALETSFGRLWGRAALVRRAHRGFRVNAKTIEARIVRAIGCMYEDPYAAGAYWHFEIVHTMGLDIAVYNNHIEPLILLTRPHLHNVISNGFRIGSPHGQLVIVTQKVPAPLQINLPNHNRIVPTHTHPLAVNILLRPRPPLVGGLYWPRDPRYYLFCSPHSLRRRNAMAE